MGSQAEGRDFMNARNGPAGRETPQEEEMDTHFRQLNVLGKYDGPHDQRSRALGLGPGNPQNSNGNIPAVTVTPRGGLDNNEKAMAGRGSPRPSTTATTTGSKQRSCRKCGEPLTGQFVRALGGTFHLECFSCKDCGQIVASKFFPIDDENGEGQYPLCETDYFRRLDLLCFKCGTALRGSYVTALEHKYHIDHFMCSVCPTAFGAKDSYYEHEGKVYCHYHYSTQFAQRCNGCQTAILKQFVEIYRNGQNQHWHPECYMIHKFWTVKLASAHNAKELQEPDQDATEMQRIQVRQEEEEMDERVYQIWSVLSAFEESSAACISDMLLHVSNGAYYEGLMMAKKFISHVELLFTATDALNNMILAKGYPGLAYGREAKFLSKKIVAFFGLLSQTQEKGVKRLGVTQDLLTLVTGLAHYLKLLIRIGLQGTLKFERETGIIDGLRTFLDCLSRLDFVDEEPISGSNPVQARLAEARFDLCPECRAACDGECLKIGELRWHHEHLRCSGCHRDMEQESASDLDRATWSEAERQVFCAQCAAHKHVATSPLPVFVHVTRLQQYIFLLRISLSRLLSVLKKSGALPHTTDDPTLTTISSKEGHVTSNYVTEPSMMSAESRSKSYGDIPNDEKTQSSLQQTVGEMKRLRSMRMEKRLSTTMKTTRTSRIIDGPEGQSIAAGLAEEAAQDQRMNKFRIVEDRDINGVARPDLGFGHPGALALDDIPRIAAAEQAKEQRPNAFKHSRNGLFSPGREGKLQSGEQRRVKFGEEIRGSSGGPPAHQNKRYFSDLSGLEYFIVRTIAVLELQTLLSDHFNQEDLMSLIETTRKPTFWNKFGKAFKNDKPKPGKKKGVFGVGLDTLIERDGTEVNSGVGSGYLRIPSLLDDTISAMRQMDMSVEGVFRKNGNIRGLREMAERIDAKDDVDLSKESPVQVAALLKKFLRELPDPLLTHKLHDLFSASQRLKEEEDRMRVLHLTCCLLPKSHRDSVEILFSFLNWAASFSQVDEESGSKMDAHNLATVITPNILCVDPSKAVGVTDSFEAIEAVHKLIIYNEMMCEVPEEVVSIAHNKDLFTNPADITTKEILKRYGEVRRSTGGQYNNANSETDLSSLRSPDSNGNPRPGAPMLTRVDTDPHQATAWQKESSVRHVQQNGAPSFPQHRQETPPQHSFDFANPNSPYHQRGGSADSARSFNVPNRNSHRQSGWGRNNGSGPMGVTGAG